ncbi:MAG: alpha/beta hydrolase [Maricaulaceae bacterium]
MIQNYNFTPLICAITLLMASCGGSSGSKIITSPPPSGDGTNNSNGSNGTGNNILKTLDVRYGPNANNLLDIHQPSNSCTEKRPTVVFAHGGGFVGGDKAANRAQTMGPPVLEKGWNFVSINYRLEEDNAVLSPNYQAIYDDTRPTQPQETDSIVRTFVAALEDANTALNFLAANEDAYCMDTSRLAVWGSSAGAYTMLSSTYLLDNYGITGPKPDVLIDYWGDLVLDQTLGFMETPFLALHGDDDPIVPYQHALDLTARADEVNVPYSLYTVINGGHGDFDLNTVMIGNKTIMETTIDFIEAHIVGGVATYEKVTVSK